MAAPPTACNRTDTRILDSVEQHEAYLFRRGRNASIARLSADLMVSILARVETVRDRNVCSLVCRAWRAWERESRVRLHLRGTINDLADIRGTFNAVTDLDLTDVNPGWEGSEQGLTEMFQACFPRLRRVKANVSPSGLQYVRHSWPMLEEVVIGHWDGPDDFLESRHVADLIASCRNLVSIDLSWSRNCDFNDLPAELGGHEYQNLRAINVLGGPCVLRDTTLEGLAAACPGLREISFSIADGSVTDAGILKLAQGCPQLQQLSVEDVKHEVLTSVEAVGAITAATVAALARFCPGLRILSLILAGYVKRSGPAFEVLAQRCRRLHTVRVSRFLGLCKRESKERDVRGRDRKSVV